MDFVTISDHNSIRGALEIAHLPGTFISNETTTYFPEDGCKVHVLVFGISGAAVSHDSGGSAPTSPTPEISAGGRHSLLGVASPVSRQRPVDRQSRREAVADVSAIRGRQRRPRPARANLVNAVFRHLTPELIGKMADRHGIEPAGPEPWKKTFTGGSDDHSGVYAGIAHTVTPYAEDVSEFLAHLKRRGPRGRRLLRRQRDDGAQFLPHRLPVLQSSLLRGDRNGKPTILGELFKRLLQRSPAQPQTSGFRGKVRSLAKGFFWSRHLNKLNEMERTLVEEFSQLFAGENRRNAASPPMDNRRTFRIACEISHTLGYGFFRRFVEFARQGKLMESLQAIASLGPVALSMAPTWRPSRRNTRTSPSCKRWRHTFPPAAELRNQTRARPGPPTPSPRSTASAA